MSEFTDLKVVGFKVFAILTEIPESRDDDRILLCEVWKRESKARDIDEWFNELLNGTISNPETITRMRRKLQEVHVALRGNKWEIRHQMEGAVCQQLTFFDKW